MTVKREDAQKPVGETANQMFGFAAAASSFMGGIPEQM